MVQPNKRNDDTKNFIQRLIAASVKEKLDEQQSAAISNCSITQDMRRAIPQRKVPEQSTMQKIMADNCVVFLKFLQEQDYQIEGIAQTIADQGSLLYDSDTELS